MLHFASPFWFIALLLPLLLLWFTRRNIKNNQPQQVALTHPFADLFEELTPNSPPRKNTPWLWLTAITLMPFALAQPQWLDTHSEDSIYGRDIVLALDVSGSTRAQDFVINDQVIDRLDMIKHVANGFIDQRQGDRIGVIIFGDDAYTLIPMSSDLLTVKNLISSLDNNIAGEKTALGDALALASKRLQDNQQRQRVIILITDGANTTGKVHPQLALNTAKELNIRIHTIGIGSHRRVAFPRAVNEQPELVQMPLDETLLQQLAEETGGLYFLGEDSQALQQISLDINRIEQSQRTSPRGASSELYWLPLLFSLGCLLLALWRQHRAASTHGDYTYD